MSPPRRATKLPRDPGPPAWSALLPPGPPPRPLEGADTADWLVIGAGWAGLAAARRLSQLRGEDRIAVLEAGRVGDGPAGRNSGFMIDLPHKLTARDYAGQADTDRRQTAQNRAAIAFWAEAAAEHGLDAEAFSQPGKVNAAATAKGLAQNQSYARHLEALGEPHEMLGPAEMRALTGSDYYLGGLYTPGTALVQPAKFVREIARALSPTVRIHEASPVTALERRGADWVAITPGGQITAPRIILAVNGHAESFGYFARRLVHIHLYASMTRALSPGETRALGGVARWGLTPSDPAGSTVRRIDGTGGTRLLIRNRMTYDPGLTSDERRLARLGRSHDRALAARFPALAGIEMAYRWGGRLCLSLNDAPAFGEVEEGVVAACCQNGLGTTRGTTAGILAADLSARGNHPMVADYLGAPAPRRLPPEPIAGIGARATMAWREWRAGREL